MFFRLNHYFKRSGQEFAAKVAHWRSHGRDPTKLEASAEQIEVDAYRDEAILRFLAGIEARTFEGTHERHVGRGWRFVSCASLGGVDVKYTVVLASS